MSDSLRFYKQWLLLGWAMVAGVIILSLVPVPDMGVDLPSDKLLHLLAYGCMMGWFVQLFHGSERIYYALGFILLGFAMELLQGVTSYRMFEWWDAVANGSGVVLAYLFGFTKFDLLLYRFERVVRIA